MKKVTLIVPDKIFHVYGNERQSTKIKDVNAISIIFALTMNRMHENYYFPKDQVRVESIENINGKE